MPEFWASGTSVFKLAAKGGAFDKAPGIPLASGLALSSNDVCSLLKALPVGSTDSSVISLLVKLISTLISAFKLPAPTIGVKRDTTLDLYISPNLIVWDICSSVAVEPASLEGLDNNSPNWSITVIFSEGKLGTEDATRWTIDWTCCLPNDLPFASLINTEADGNANSLAKTVFSGIAKCTLAELIPDIKVIERDNSASKLCLIFIASTERLVPIGISPKLWYPSGTDAGKPSAAKSILDWW